MKDSLIELDSSLSVGVSVVRITRCTACGPQLFPEQNLYDTKA